MRVAEPTIERLVQYHRLLETLKDEGHRVVSSQQIGDLLGFKASQVRKDLSYFGEIGKRGVGYHVERLCDHIVEILSSPKIWRIAMAGVGNMGTALLLNPAFRSPKVRFEALFDIDPRKTGRDISGIHCWHFTEIPSVMSEKEIEVLILAVPAHAAQRCVDLAIASKALRGVLALTQGSLVVPEEILVVRVDIMAELEKLLFFMKQPEAVWG
ncbi:MAG: redox-sensing transcriptional repressor Rex [Synergistaceae bacterium]|jgi:redox-sensing transcriptional repressor|nr:redox-sensing transcriptional repressor Rex [Synergistaceae bacterium]